MDSSKLLNILFDINSEEIDAKPSDAVGNILSYYTQLQTQNNPELSKSIKSNLDSLEKLSETSVFNNYPPSDKKIISKIGGSGFIGTEVFHSVSEIIDEVSFINEETLKKLNNFHTSRNKFIETVRSLKNNLEEFNIDPHFSEEDFEFGILRPENVEHNTFSEIKKSLHRWNIILLNINEITGDPQEEPKLSFVNNGSFEFFTESPEATLTALAIIIERLATLYKKTLEIRLLRLKMKDYKFPKNEVTAAENHEKESLDSGMDEIVEEIFKEYSSKKIDKGRLNELKNALKKHIKYIGKEIDSGVRFEVRTPELVEPKKAEKNADPAEIKKVEKARKDYELKLKKVDLIKKAIETSKEFVGGAKEVFKLINLEETDIEDGESDNENK